MSSNNDKTIIIIRYGEKPNPDTGLLTCQGFNRAQHIAQQFTTNYPTPNKIYTVMPSTDNNGDMSEGRSFMTILPYAIMNNIPININYTWTNPTSMVNLATILYNNDCGYYIITWEHKHIQPLTEDILSVYNNNNIKVIYNNTAQDIPHWGSTNFDSIYILQYNAKNNTISFSIEQENLNNMSTICPN